MATEIKWADGQAILSDTTIRWADGGVFQYYEEEEAPPAATWRKIRDKNAGIDLFGDRVGGVY